MANGLLIVDKPAGMTSHDVVSILRRVFNEKSVGHIGTLDPMATGVLPMLIGRYTRLAQFFGDTIKAYDGEIQFGFTTDTYDAEGERTSEPRDLAKLTLKAILEVSRSMTGANQQVPPPYSAKKIGGVPAYKLARKDQEPKLKAVPVEVFEFEILDYADGRARFRALVSSGTYIRSLAHELGQRLGVGAHLSALRRTRVGEFTLEQAHSLEQLKSLEAPGDELFLHPRTLLPEMPSVTVTEQIAAYIRNGRAVNLPEMSTAKLVKVFVGQRELLAISNRIAGTLFHSKVVLYGNNEPMPSPTPVSRA